MRQSTNQRGGAEPQVWFRIVHVAEDGHHRALGDACREQTVAIARREGITRARVTQIMGMLRLAPKIQEHILAMAKTVRQPAISERALRPIAKLDDPTDQRTRFVQLIGHMTSGPS